MTAKNTIKSKPSIFTSELTRRLLPQKMVFSTRYLEQSDCYRQVLLVKNFPATFQNKCILTKAAQIKNTVFSMWLCPMPESEARRLINNQINNKAAGRFSKKGTEQIQSNMELENITDFYELVIRENHKIYYVNIYVEVFADSLKELAENCTRVKNSLLSASVTTELLIHEQKWGFLGVSPLGRDLLTMARNNLPTSSLAATYPFSYSSHNDSQGMMLGMTEDGGYVFLDLWHRDDDRPNSSFAIIGESGRGKSYLMKKIILQQIIRGTNVFVLDPEDEYSTLIRKLGGTVINCASGSFKINPFEVRTLKTDEDDEADVSIPAMQFDQSLFQHLSWMQDFFKVLFPHASPADIADLMILVKDMYQRKGIDEQTDFSKLAPEDYPTFTDLFHFIYEVLKNQAQFPFYQDTFLKEKLQELLRLIKDAYDGSLSSLFNGCTNITNAKIINFNIQELLTGSEERTQAFLFNVMTYLWNRILKKENHTLLCVDELYLVMNRENIIIAKYLKDFTKRARKYEAAIGLATQQLGDFLDDAIYHISSALFNTPLYKFMFNPGELDFQKIQKLLQLTEGEKIYINTAQKRHCLLKIGSRYRYGMMVGALPFESEYFGKAGGR